MATKEPESAPQTANTDPIPPLQGSLRVDQSCLRFKAAAAQVSRQTWKKSFSTGTIDYMGKVTPSLARCKLAVCHPIDDLMGHTFRAGLESGRFFGFERLVPGSATITQPLLVNESTKI